MKFLKGLNIAKGTKDPRVEFISQVLTQIFIDFSFMTKPQLPNLQQTIANTIFIINTSNTNNLKKIWVGFITQGRIKQVY